MNWFSRLISRLFNRKSKWDELEYTDKPSTAGDEFRDKNSV